MEDRADGEARVGPAVGPCRLRRVGERARLGRAASRFDAGGVRELSVALRRRRRSGRSCRWRGPCPRRRGDAAVRRRAVGRDRTGSAPSLRTTTTLVEADRRVRPGEVDLRVARRRVRPVTVTSGGATGVALIARDGATARPSAAPRRRSGSTTPFVRPVSARRRVRRRRRPACRRSGRPGRRRPCARPSIWSNGVVGFVQVRSTRRSPGVACRFADRVERRGRPASRRPRRRRERAAAHGPDRVLVERAVRQADVGDGRAGAVVDEACRRSGRRGAAGLADDLDRVDTRRRGFVQLSVTWRVPGVATARPSPAPGGRRAAWRRSAPATREAAAVIVQTA